MKRLIEQAGVALTNIGWFAFHALALIMFNPFERKGYYGNKKENHRKP